MQAHTHPHHPSDSNRRGFTLAELLMAVVVFTVAAVVLGNHISVNYSVTKFQRERVFAFAKAQAILSEIHTFVDTGEIEAAVDLDVLDDGASFNPVLTISDDGAGNPVAADHVLSGNTLRGASTWTWSRRISVRPFAGRENRTVRYVTVRIFRKDQAGVDRELASLSSVINSIGAVFPPTQAFDVYLLAMENVPGWWVYMDSIIPFVESAITDLQNRNPGLEIRSHWITKVGYGRNRSYRPVTNLEVDSLQDVLDVYWYPGKMPDGESSNYYYVPDLIHGRVLVDGTERNGYDATVNPYPYALADHYNHAMRYPQAKAFHDLRMQEIANRRQAITDAVTNGFAAPPELDDMSEEPTWQVLLEEMSSNPAQYRNALFLNLHGELLPMPPLRNYSDAAKDPATLPNVRVVTHPEEIRTHRPQASGEAAVPAGVSTDLKLRVYAWNNDKDYVNELDPENYAGTRVMPQTRPIAVQVMDLDLTDGSGGLHPDVRIENLRGGVNGAGVVEYSPFAAATTTTSATEMYYEVEFVDPGPGLSKFTLFRLYNTPLIAPVVVNTTTNPGAVQGLAVGDTVGATLPAPMLPADTALSRIRSRLYGQDYQPSCPGPWAVAGTPDYSRDLAADGLGPKNTARWTITISGDVFGDRRFVPETALSSADYIDPNDGLPQNRDRMITVRTRIWDPAATDTDVDTVPDELETGLWPMGSDARTYTPDNVSETYSWWADTIDSVPVTERAQFTGDPRHNPYKDLLDGDPDFPNAYNRHFDSLQNNSEDSRADYPGIAFADNMWQGTVQLDVPRYMEVLRSALIGAECIWTTLTGYSYYYMGVGNEIGYDSANGYPSSIPVSWNPWGGGLGSTSFINNITWGWRGVIAQGWDWPNHRWWGIPWLGELYPDYAYSTDFAAADANGDFRGNLTAGSDAVSFMRYAQGWTHWDMPLSRSYGELDKYPQQRLNTPGCVTLFNNGDTSNHFNHHFRDGQTGNLVGPGLELDNNYGLDLPGNASINRPFSLLSGGNTPGSYGQAPYTTTRTTATLLRTYYDHQAGEIGSGLVQLENTAGTDAAFIVVNGIAQTTAMGAALIGKYCLLSMFQSYFELGDTSLTHRIAQPARVEIFSPTEISELIDPATIDIEFRSDWNRWDGQPYTASTPVGFAEDELLLEYVPMYSADNGTTWRYMTNDAPAEVGRRPTDPSVLVADTGTGDETHVWAVPTAGFPEGTYLVRVECYRLDQALHYSHHQVRIYIER